jgi:hypothetical protein
MSENTHDEIHPPNPTNKHAQKGHTTTGEWNIDENLTKTTHIDKRGIDWVTKEKKNQTKVTHYPL